MVGYEFDVGQFLSREIQDRAEGGEKLVLPFPCMINQICLATGVQELPVIDQFSQPKNTTNLVLIRDAANPMIRQTKQRAILLGQAMQSRGQSAEDTEDDEVPAEGGQSKTYSRPIQPSNLTT